MKKIAILSFLLIIVILIVVSPAYGVTSIKKSPNNKDFSNLNAFYSPYGQDKIFASFDFRFPDKKWHLRYSTESGKYSPSVMEKIDNPHSRLYPFEDFEYTYSYDIYRDIKIYNGDIGGNNILTMEMTDKYYDVEKQSVVIEMLVYGGATRVDFSITNAFDYTKGFEAINFDRFFVPFLPMTQVFKNLSTGENIEFSLFQVKYETVSFSSRFRFSRKYNSDSSSFSFRYSFCSWGSGVYYPLSSNGKYAYDATAVFLWHQAEGTSYSDYEDSLTLVEQYYCDANVSINERSYLVSFPDSFEKKLPVLGWDISGGLRCSGAEWTSVRVCVGMSFAIARTNVYTTNGFVRGGSELGGFTTQDCEWYDIPCHLGNAVLKLLFDFPLTSGLIKLVNTIFSAVDSSFAFIGLFSGLGILFTVFIVFFILRLARWLTG